MRKAWWLNIALLVIVTGLGLYAYLKPGTTEPVQHALATISPAQVQKLVIVHGGNTIELVKKDNLWSLAAPVAARADASQVNRMLDILSVKSKEKLAQTNLARFDLDKPAITLRFDAHVMSFGTTNSLTQDQYVLSDGSVYLIPSYYAQQIPNKPDRLLTHSLFAEGEKPVAFELSAIAAEQKDGKWEVTRRASKEGALSQDDLNRWADDWRLSSSLLTQPYSGNPGIDQIRVKLADGKMLTLEVLQKEPDLVLARTDEKLQFQYSTEAGKRLLEPKPEPLPEAPSTGTEKK